MFKVFAALVAAAGMLLAFAFPSAALPLKAPVAVPVSFESIPVRETGVVSKILDGDTFWFTEDGTGASLKVRMLGINTPEVTGFNNIHFDQNMCGGPAAAAFLESVMPVGTRVQLRAVDAASSNKGRALRYVFAYNPATGKYDQDMQAPLASAGLALWFAIEGESTLSAAYRALVDAAQDAGRGIWNPSFCGPPEQPDAAVSLVTVWDAPGPDTADVNGEYVIVRNTGSSAVDLSGWLLRDSSLEAWFTFPPGTVLAVGDWLVVHSGQGAASGRNFFAGSTVPLFPNAATSPDLVGDGSYLLDRSWSVRSWFEYPCTQCSSPLSGALKISKVNAKSTSPRPPTAANQEFIKVTNTSSSSVLLDGVFLRRQVSTFAFPPGTVLPAKSTVTVRIGSGANTAVTFYWGRPAPLLTNAHDKVSLHTADDLVLDQVSW